MLNSAMDANTNKLDLSSPANWKEYLTISLKFLIIFYLITFCLMIFIKHSGDEWLITDIFVASLYIFIFANFLKKLLYKFSMPVILLAAPTIPLIMLMLVISMIPVIQVFESRINTWLFSANFSN